MKYSITALCVSISALLVAGCVSDQLAKKDDVTFVETSMNREMSALKQQVDLSNSKSDEAMQRIQATRRSFDEQTAALSKDNESLKDHVKQQGEQIAALQRELAQTKADLTKVMDTKMDALLDAIVKENQKVVQQINRRQGHAAEKAPASSKASPAAAAAPAASQPAPAPASGGATQAADADNGFYHTIERGQTISQIASQYGVTIDEILQANELSDPDRLSVGQQILIPKKQN